MQFTRKNIALLIMSLNLMVAPAMAKEQAVVLDKDLQAIENDGLSADRTSAKGAVLMIHGWASQMNEVGDMYARLAAQLAEQGYASLRVNIRGESERELTNYTMDSTFNSRVADAQAGLDYLRQHYPKLPVALVGFSLGGATAMALTGNNPQVISSLVLWSSAGDPGEISRQMPAATVQEILTKGQAKLQQWVELTITRMHLLGMMGHDVFSKLQHYQGALLSIRGTEDFVPAQESSIFAHANASPEEAHIISGADHIFNSLTPGNPYSERVIQHTVRWFNDTLREGGKTED